MNKHVNVKFFTYLVARQIIPNALVRSILEWWRRIVDKIRSTFEFRRVLGKNDRSHRVRRRLELTLLTSFSRSLFCLTLSLICGIWVSISSYWPAPFEPNRQKHSARGTCSEKLLTATLPFFVFELNSFLKRFVQIRLLSLSPTLAESTDWRSSFTSSSSSLSRISPPTGSEIFIAAKRIFIMFSKTSVSVP